MGKCNRYHRCCDTYLLCLQSNQKYLSRKSIAWYADYISFLPLGEKLAYGFVVYHHKQIYERGHYGAHHYISARD